MMARNTDNLPIDTMTDQQLVDVYKSHAPGWNRSGQPNLGDDHIQWAASAAYNLELRGYVEQAGVWLHTALDDLTPTS